MRANPSAIRENTAPDPGEGLHETVARRAALHPGAVALVTDGGRTTYGELDRTADAWAARLTAAGVTRSRLVPVLLPRSPELVTAVLAILKSGAAYALLDRSWPDARLHEMFRALDAPLLVSADPADHRHGLPLWSPPTGPVARRTGFRPVSVAGSEPACVFFTSGTTGTPKAVLSPHRATARLFPADGSARFTAATVMPLAAPVSWDAFSLELWSVLLSGGTSVVVDEPYLSAESLRGAVVRHGVDTVWLTSSLFNMIVEEDLDAFTGLGQVMTGGERLSPGHVGRFLERHPTVGLLNGYGPVESAVFATTHRVTRADCRAPDGIPLGRPAPGTEVHVLAGDRPCPPGETGEICVAGPGLALGYLGDPALTGAKFADVRIDGRTTRVYRTGDLGFWGTDGLLRFRGRADRQIKIHGHRVEPAEVEQQVQRLLPEVRDCRVLARPDATGTTRELVAFCVPAATGDPLAAAPAVLRSGLVGYQRPAAVVSVDAFPVTARGKLDERALLALAPPARAPVPLAGDEAGTGGGDAPHRNGPRSADPLRRLVADAFRSVLGRADVPEQVPFTELGGDSLGAGRVCARLAARLGRPVPVSRLYARPTVASLAEWLAGTAHPGPAPEDPASEDVPLTPMQLVYLTRHLVQPADRTSHSLLTWTIEGELDRAALGSAVAAVHRAHQALAAAYLPDPHPRARPAGAPAPSPVVLGARPSVADAVRAVREELSVPLEPTEGRVWRTALVPVADASVTVFGCVVHHIAFDGWSESVLARSLGIAYRHALGVSPPEDPPPTLRAVHRAHRERLAHTDQAGQYAAVRSEMAGVPELHWPSGPTEAASAAPRELMVTVPPGVVTAVDSLAARAGATRFGVLLGYCASSLGAVTGQRDFAVGVPVAQRDHDLLTRSVGCRITMVPVRMRGAALDGGLAGARASAAAGRRALAAQDVPIDDLLRLAGPRRRGRPPLFQTLFALQDNAEPRLDLPGLRTAFLRLPYLDLPLELHTELWPDEHGGMRLVVSYRPEAVPEAAAQEYVKHFTHCLYTTPSGVRP
ncbi:amino acid adenylation domain-containing protein [Streptomyces sp. NPDC003247]|uniref:amino acid adenylation domain-containing protein n=1 Tax=Streptomyces sp. NPDC003247 TaxID=3364677 RepID=UPI003690A29C